MPITFENKKSDTQDILISGLIVGEKVWDEDVSPKWIKDQLDSIDTKKIKNVDVYINSDGGSVFAGIAIYSFLKSFAGNTRAIVTGVAASIASVVMQGCKERVVSIGSRVMIHNPAIVGYIMATAADLKKFAEQLDMTKDDIIDIYSTRASVSKEKVSEMMDAETWMSGKDAVELGFADSVDSGMITNMAFNGDLMFVNGINMDKRGFKNIPVDAITEEQERLKAEAQVKNGHIEHIIGHMSMRSKLLGVK